MVDSIVAESSLSIVPRIGLGGSRQSLLPKIPQQNGVAERMNWTLNERAKSMRLHAGLPKMFWKDLVNTPTYLINRGPSMPLGFQITKEEWQRKEVGLTHLKLSLGTNAYHVESGMLQG
ncbi:retrovirus-related pol polyprotein from transposon TNT 1-94 [Tanacetum coccineum]